MPKVICSGCLKVRDTSPCTRCATTRQRTRDAHRGTTTQRGLGWAHRQRRSQLIAQAEQHAPITHCPRCSRPITKDNPISAEHSKARVHGGKQADQLICKSCNSSAGATLRKH